MSFSWLEKHLSVRVLYSALKGLYRIKLLFVFLSSGLMFPTVGWSKNTVGITSNKVYIGTSQPLSGPASAWGNIARSMEAYFKYVNEMKGGVNGRKIELVIKDDRYQPELTLRNIKEMANKVFALAGVIGTKNIKLSREFIAAEGIPVVMPLGDVGIWINYPEEKLKYFFVAYPDYTAEAAFLTKYAIKKFGARKIAVFYLNDLYGKRGLEGVKNVALDKVALELPHSRKVDNQTIKTYVYEIQAQKIDTVIIYSAPDIALNFAKELKENAKGVRILTSFTLGDPGIAKMGGEAWEGVVSGLLVKIPSLFPESKKWFDRITKINPELKRTPVFTTLGIWIGMIVEEGLKRAGRKLTREKFIEALETLKNFETPVGFSITWNKKRRHGANTIYMVEVEKGRFRLLEGPFVFPPLF